MAIKHNNLLTLPHILYNIASALNQKGDKPRARDVIKVSYYIACAVVNFAVAEQIRQDAGMSFSISL